MLRREVLPANIYILVVCLSHIYTARCQNVCVDKSSCKCTFKDGSVVDLSSLGKTDSTPRFKDVVSTDGNLYSYNPCYGFNEGSGCTDASVCLIIPGRKQHILIAEPSDGSFQNDPVSKKLVLYYFNQVAGVPVTVDIICDEKAQDPLFRSNGLRETGLSLSLTSKCACIDGCKITGSISAGTVLCIIFFSLLVAYLIGGMVFMKVRMKTSGLQVIPNIEFWKSIPGLIKDGVIFTVVRPSRCSRYQKI